MELMEHQLEVVDQLDTGKILYGNVGAGKTAAVLAYYKKYESPRDIFVITTAKKRDSLDWEKEAAKFGICAEEGASLTGYLNVDSWNNIHKFRQVQDAFFVFDEQRVVGHGSWVKSFIKIAQRNRWVLLSATPGDTWMDYAPVFIANGFYKNITEFKMQHVLYEPYSKYPKIRMYLNETKLEMLRNEILVEMPFTQENRRILNYMDVGFDEGLWRKIFRERWNIYENRPIKDAAELFRLMRKVVNTDPSRLEMVKHLMRIHPRLVIFYNFDYELEILRTLRDRVKVAEWNGHRKNPIPKNRRWIYLVQYVAGAEGWNCVETNAMVLYSMTYSYKSFIQAQGRIDRLDTHFYALYYYIFVSNSKIDSGIKAALMEKRNFNERKFIREELLNLGDQRELAKI